MTDLDRMYRIATARGYVVVASLAPIEPGTEVVRLWGGDSVWAECPKLFVTGETTHTDFDRQIAMEWPERELPGGWYYYRAEPGQKTLALEKP